MLRVNMLQMTALGCAELTFISILWVYTYQAA